MPHFSVFTRSTKKFALKRSRACFTSISNIWILFCTPLRVVVFFLFPTLLLVLKIVMKHVSRPPLLIIFYWCCLCQQIDLFQYQNEDEKGTEGLPQVMLTVRLSPSSSTPAFKLVFLSIHLILSIIELNITVTECILYQSCHQWPSNFSAFLFFFFWFAPPS